MKTHAILIVFAASLATALSVQAQTLLTDFSSSSGWAASSRLVGSSGTFSISSGVANYTVASSGASEFAYLANTAFVASYTSDWTIRVNVTYASPGSIYSGETVEQAINAGLLVAKTGTSLGLNGSNDPTFDAFALNANLYSNGSGTYTRDIRTSVLVADTEPVDNETRYYNTAASGIWTSTLKIAFNSSTKVLSGSFDGTGGTSFTLMNTAAGDSVNASSWGMSGSDTFTIYLVGNSLYDGNTSGLGPNLSLGEVTLDNLYATGAVSAVPEPSTYAAIFGALALGFAAWRRKQRVAVTA